MWYFSLYHSQYFQLRTISVGKTSFHTIAQEQKLIHLAQNANSITEKKVRL
ncbi:hypothetical protein FC85_GL002863 [Lentilactobacillus diolivorans DSM 14421]|uniref:Uncharacterized protein n=1 Tax=Lentilactobacillus diolivorans DSM 14421 TaxID=1423739 RepID=A0A0R1SIJ8_9LACO|nr:hypothetical protein FC85_GL002863 [Lentilactobacillus diolivorans DSM 14421]